MGQLFFTDETGRRWMCGWDNPSQGYYASRESLDPDEEFDIMAGFSKGVTLERLCEACAAFDFTLSNEQIEMLKADKDERPLTALQKNIHVMFEGLYAPDIKVCTEDK
jgi:hypothetical protein